MRFCEILRDEFVSSKLGRGEFAEKIGVSRVTLNSYLAGDTEPVFSAACEILKQCNRNVIIAKHYDYDEYFPRKECEECEERLAMPESNKCQVCILAELP